MPTPYRINITMTQDTIAGLKPSGFTLYGFKAVQTQNPSAAPLVWFRADPGDVMTSTQVNWSEDYQAYVSNSQIITNGIIDGSNAVNMDLGQTVKVDQNANFQTPVAAGNADAITLYNISKNPFKSSGISQKVGKTFSPMVALELHGGTEEEIVPIEKVLLMFAASTVNTGTVIYASYSDGLLIDLTDAPGNPKTRDITYAIDQGWDWGQAQWGKFYAANASLVPILISSTPDRKRK